MNNVLVIAAHPDDEVLGCGGTIAKHIKNKDIVNCLIMAEGITSRDIKDKEKKRGLEDLREAIFKAHKVLGTTTIQLENLPDNQMDLKSRLVIVKIIEKYLNKYKPEIVYTHFDGDLNIDHQITSQAVITACRPLITTVKSILFFEVPSSTEWQCSQNKSGFNPNWFEDINATLSLKMEALKYYNSELRSWPHPRSLEGVEHLARWRGCAAGLEAAEAFVLGRFIK